MDQEHPLREWGEADFDREVLGFGGRVVVMFGDPRWSGPCRMTRLALERLAPQMPGVLFGVVNISDSPGLCDRFGADAMPTVLVFEKGVEVRRVIGWRRQEEWPGLLAGDSPAPAGGRPASTGGRVTAGPSPCGIPNPPSCLRVYQVADVSRRHVRFIKTGQGAASPDDADQPAAPVRHGGENEAATHVATMEVIMPEPPRHHFIHVATGESFAVDDPVAWCLEHARDPLLERARERLLQCDGHTDPQRILNIVYRRCGLNLAEVRPGRIVVHHWTALADIRSFCKLHGLVSPDVQVALVRHKDGLVVVQSGDDFLYGTLLGEIVPLHLYRTRWDHRFERQPDDGEPAPWSTSSYSWAGVREGRIPWAALKSIWRREQAILCPNCDTPLAAWSFTWRHRTLLSMHGFIARCCFACRRDFREDAGDLWPWLAATLDADVLPSSQDDGIHQTDLRPRWPAPPKPRNLYDLDNLPPDLTLDELVRILM